MVFYTALLGLDLEENCFKYFIERKEIVECLGLIPLTTVETLLSRIPVEV